ncbi:MAG: hypothetical protein Q8P61_06270 [Candidatus Nanopelagicales bacterium]|nr:hypothetical protein [Candidatus Nanopelagicales bacterium]
MNGRNLTAEISSGSNTTVKATLGNLYGIFAYPTGQGGSVRVEDGDLGATPDLNASGDNTIIRITSLASNTANYTDLKPGVGFGKLVIAATSNTRVVAVYE